MNLKQTTDKHNLSSSSSLLFRHGLLPPVSRASRSFTGTRQVTGRAAIVRGTTQRQGGGQAIALAARRHPGI